jgi:hypothetical protein
MRNMSNTRSFDETDATFGMCSRSNRWSSGSTVRRDEGDKEVGRRHSAMGASPCRIPRQCFQRNSQELDRETPLRAPSQSSRRHNDLHRDLSIVEHSLQAMASFVLTVESKPGNAEALQAHLRRSLPPKQDYIRRSLPPRLPQRQTSVRRASVL